ncbi:MAG: hypothetical protein MK135_04560 [Polyangiaceae bacterium]|nr:hypothetical protein [Polyangiaceae bacterium]
MRDELQEPQIANLRLFAAEQELHANTRSPSSSDSTTGKGISTDRQGRFCLRTQASAHEITIQANASNYRRFRAPLEQLTPEAFGSLFEIEWLPEKWNIRDPKPVSGIILVQSNTRTDIELSLSIQCEDQRQELVKKRWQGEERISLEFSSNSELQVGNCSFLVEALSDGQPSKRRQDVLLVAPAKAEVLKQTSEELVVAVKHEGHPLTAGMIELRDHSQILASAPVAHGQARIFLPRLKVEEQVELQYHPVLATVLESPPVELTLLPGPKTSVARLAILAAAVLTLGGMLWFWFAPRKRARDNTEVPQTVATRSKAKGPIKIEVMDTDTGSPIPGTVLTLYRRTATKLIELETATTNARGNALFTNHFSREQSLLFSAVHPHYTYYRGPIDGRDMTLRLKTLRRAIVQRVFEWVRFRSTASTKPAETLLGVAREAQRRGDSATAQWAAQAAQRAYDLNNPSQADFDELSDGPKSSSS